MHILLIAGGWSAERDVSLSGANAIEQTLKRLGHEVRLFDPAHSLAGLASAAQNSDFAFINLHGKPGEDGLIQAFLDRLGRPYQGSGPAASFLALDKATAKELFRLRGLKTPDWAFLHSIPEKGWEPGFGWPLFVKPNTGGSSLDASCAGNPEELRKALKSIFKSGETALVEPCIFGTEVSCGILGAATLPPVLIKPVEGRAFFDYVAKYTKGAAIEICPAPLPEPVIKEIQRATEAAYGALGLEGYGRADFILAEDNELYLLEINTLPGMTATSLIPQEAAAIGMSFDHLIARLIELGLERHAARSA